MYWVEFGYSSTFSMKGLGYWFQLHLNLHEEEQEGRREEEGAAVKRLAEIAFLYFIESRSF